MAVITLLAQRAAIANAFLEATNTPWVGKEHYGYEWSPPTFIEHNRNVLTPFLQKEMESKGTYVCKHYRNGCPDNWIEFDPTNPEHLDYAPMSARSTKQAELEFAEICADYWESVGYPD